VHFIGIVVCILGMGCMVGADVLVGRHQGAGEFGCSPGDLFSGVRPRQEMECLWNLRNPGFLVSVSTLFSTLQKQHIEGAQCIFLE
jgi:hypothetical protein